MCVYMHALVTHIHNTHTTSLTVEIYNGSVLGFPYLGSTSGGPLYPTCPGMFVQTLCLCLEGYSVTGPQFPATLRVKSTLHKPGAKGLGGKSMDNTT